MNEKEWYCPDCNKLILPTLKFCFDCTKIRRLKKRTIKCKKCSNNSIYILGYLKPVYGLCKDHCPQMSNSDPSYKLKTIIIMNPPLLVEENDFALSVAPEIESYLTCGREKTIRNYMISECRFCFDTTEKCLENSCPNKDHSELLEYLTDKEAIDYENSKIIINRQLNELDYKFNNIAADRISKNLIINQIQYFTSNNTSDFVNYLSSRDTITLGNYMNFLNLAYPKPKNDY